MASSHITPENKIIVAQQKTGRRLLIPLHRDLEAALAVAKRDHLSIITTVYGKSFTVDGFSQWMRDAIKDAGLPLDCQPHGLRKATGRRLAEAGATAKMITSVLSHTTLAEAERYRLALPREARISNCIKHLPQSLGKSPGIVLQGVSARLPKQLVQYDDSPFATGSHHHAVGPFAAAVAARARGPRTQKAKTLPARPLAGLIRTTSSAISKKSSVASAITRER